MHQLGDYLLFYKTFDGLARTLLIVVVSVVNLKSILDYGNPLVKLLLSSATNIRR